jgi:phytochrome B
LRVGCCSLAGEKEHNVEIKLRTYNSQKEKGTMILIVNACSSKDVIENVVGIYFV